MARASNTIALGLKRSLFFLIVIALAGRAGAAALPGFRVERVADARGFVSSIAVDSHGTIYYTTTNGGIYRLDGPVASVATEAVGNAGLLGMALIDDRTAVVHYTRPNQTYDVISLIDLVNGSETVLHEFAGDIGNPDHGISPEHHGGNPTVGADGAIYVGIGDYGAVQIAEDPQWNGGKVFRVDRDGSAQQIARGFRNPFDIAWDPKGQQLVVPDNGDVVDDEINVITESGGFYGWPLTAGAEPAVAGAIPPAYVFPEVVAPTGITRLRSGGFVLCSFVTRALYFFDDANAPRPIAILRGETAPLIDVAESPSGDIYIATGATIYRLISPLRGDCNGDGVIDFADVGALMLELADGDPHDVHLAQDGNYRGSWGCDVDGDGLITSRDVGALWRLMTNRFPAVRRR